MIEIKELSISNRQKKILVGLNLNIDKGERVSILGKSGEGKSTLSFALLGEISEGLFLESGTIKFGGNFVVKNNLPLKGKDLQVVRRRIGHLDQDPAASLTPTMQVKNILKELAANKKDFEKECKKILKKFNLPIDENFLNKYPRELSGGQKRRIALARVLLRKPELLILDEPTSGLDEDTREQVLDLLKILINELQTTVITITHDKYVAYNLSSKHYKLSKGKLKAFKLDPPKEELLSRKNMVARNENIILEARCLTGKAPLLDIPPVKDFSFCLHEGEILGLTGKSGSGKTTIVKTILGLWPAVSGKVFLKGVEIETFYRNRDVLERLTLAYVPQDPKTSFNPAIKVDKALARANKLELSMDEVLKKVGISLKEVEGRFPDQLSGGQLQRLAMARAILGGAEIILLDEVTSSLDEKTKYEICDLVMELKGQSSMLMISHDYEVINRTCDRYIEI